MPTYRCPECGSEISSLDYERTIEIREEGTAYIANERVYDSRPRLFVENFSSNNAEELSEDIERLDCPECGEEIELESIIIQETPTTDTPQIEHVLWAEQIDFNRPQVKLTGDMEAEIQRYRCTKN